MPALLEPAWVSLLRLPPSLPRRPAPKLRHIPQTVTGTAPPSAGAARRKIFSSQVLSSERSKTIRWPASAPAAVHVAPGLFDSLADRPLQPVAAHLALHHEPAHAASVGPYDQMIDAPPPQGVLPLDTPAAVDHFLQVRLQQQLRPGFP